MGFRVIDGREAEVRPQVAALAADSWELASTCTIFTGRPGKPSELVALVTAEGDPDLPAVR